MGRVREGGALRSNGKGKSRGGGTEEQWGGTEEQREGCDLKGEQRAVGREGEGH